MPRCCCGVDAQNEAPFKFRGLVVNSNDERTLSSSAEDANGLDLTTAAAAEVKDDGGRSRGIRHDVMDSIRAVITSAESLDEKQMKLSSMISQLQTLKENLTMEQERIKVCVCVGGWLGGWVCKVFRLSIAAAVRFLKRQQRATPADFGFYFVFIP